MGLAIIVYEHDEREDEKKVPRPRFTWCICNNHRVFDHASILAAGVNWTQDDCVYEAFKALLQIAIGYQGQITTIVREMGGQV